MRERDFAAEEGIKNYWRQAGELKTLKQIGITDLFIDTARELQEDLPDICVYQTLPTVKERNVRISLYWGLERKGLRVFADDITCSYYRQFGVSNIIDLLFFSRRGKSIQIPTGSKTQRYGIAVKRSDVFENAKLAMEEARNVEPDRSKMSLIIPRGGIHIFDERKEMHEDPKIKIFPL